jgi:polyisoprenoid-binding protein YceI
VPATGKDNMEYPAMDKTISSLSQRLGTAGAVLVLGFFAELSGAAETTPPPPMPAAGPPPAGQYQLDKSHASLLMRVSHLGFSTYTTRFSRYDADLTFDPNNIPASKLVVTIDATSFEMDAAPAQCLTIMTGAQFLDVTKYPKIVFRSDTVRTIDPKSFEIAGTLELRGVSRPLVLTATYNGGYPGMAVMDPHARIGFSAHGSIKRSDFGMSFGLPAPGTTMGLGDLIEVTIETEFTGPPLAVASAGAH